MFQTGRPLLQNIVFNTVFELRAKDEDALVYRPSSRDQKQSRLAQIAKYVAATGQILNIGDVSSWMSQEVRETDGFFTRSILCMPILNGQKTVIGVAQLINKVVNRNGRGRVWPGARGALWDPNYSSWFKSNALFGVFSFADSRRARDSRFRTVTSPSSRRSPSSAGWVSTTRRCTRTRAS